MKFEQYKMLKEHALAACAAAGAPFPATKEINPILLAYIGDVVFLCMSVCAFCRLPSM